MVKKHLDRGVLVVIMVLMENKTVLRATRRARDLTLQALAHRAGISVSHAWQLDQGRVRPSVDVALRLASALGTTVEDLFRDDAARGAA